MPGESCRFWEKRCLMFEVSKTRHVHTTTLSCTYLSPVTGTKTRNETIVVRNRTQVISLKLAGKQCLMAKCVALIT